MNAKERSLYFSELWPAACLANEWPVKDEARRRRVTRECMDLVGGPATDSTTKMGPDEVTALFTYLRHLADPASLEKSARWVTCQDDYHTFNRARQADWHESETYGASKNKLDRQRFGGARSAAGDALADLDPDQVAKRHLTMATRHRRRIRQDRAKADQDKSELPLETAPVAAPEPIRAPAEAHPF